MKNNIILRFLPPLLLCVALLICMVVPASAAELFDYNDYITNIVVDGDNDLVTVEFPIDQGYSYVSYNDWTPIVDNNYVNNGLTVQWLADPDALYNVGFRPFGIDTQGYLNSVRLDNIPEDTSLEVSFRASTSTSAQASIWLWLQYTDADGSMVSQEMYDIGHFNMISSSPTLWADFTLTPPAGAVGFALHLIFYDLHVESGGMFEVELVSCRSRMSISSLYRLQQQTGKTNALLTEVNKQLEENGQKLDDIISGGPAGDDLIAGGDKIENAGDSLGDDIGQIQDFENQFMGQLEDNLDEVIAGADLTWIYPPLMFVQRYANMIVAGIPSKYMIVFTLPLVFGLFMYIVGHPVRAPRPDKSGDAAAREDMTKTKEV